MADYVYLLAIDMDYYPMVELFPNEEERWERAVELNGDFGDKGNRPSNSNASDKAARIYFAELKRSHILGEPLVPVDS